MDLYDDIDTKPRSSHIDGWSSGIKMLQTQLAVKKAQPIKKPLMTPAVSLRAKRPVEAELVHFMTNACVKPVITGTALALPLINNASKDDWDFVDEYDPQWPNEYEKLKEKSKSIEKSRSSATGNREDRDRDRERKRNRNGRRDAQKDESSPTSMKLNAFGLRQSDEERYSPPLPGSVAKLGGGAAIAPPPSLQEISIENGDGSSSVTIPYSASSVAAKIMAKYGFKDGQGLGKSEQGMSIALQVEKTSKRGGRIIHEKDVFLPPSIMSPPATVTPPGWVSPNLQIPLTGATSNDTEPSITEIMKSPSKVVLLRNMVGPGDVDEELEPEVKDECHTKYGEVNSVIIHEAFGTEPEDAVKIFVEFKRIESAIKAVVDLNGRFFGGRQVRALFFNYDKFKSFQLN
ncbi:splicing factor 45 isoform X1 [Drosophila bipectinata]|uniref:splicing factor 45 isoform X1 n=2 Tax=Drosophila bipectinata TaxID=42026 RepID=UPI001C89D6EC|nr:splicing factor 45 isoform X1 [Drosophila bipectinata]XP_017098414.2 splicing factor 45 isoform X1 [Drosophila bipectinata]XP_017098423.2 splicing factor 45 isoform X1 [Drosophila bipectinata]